MLLSFGSMTFRGLPRLISALFVAAILSPAMSFAECIEKLQGKAYIDLPQDVCPHYTDVLLGSTNQREKYSGVICDRAKVSYILLQKLLNYTGQGRAVWQVIQIKRIARSNPQSFVMGVGCQFKTQDASASQFKEPIFALVQPGKAEEYQTLAAWKVNLDQASFSALKPQQVICKNPLL
jgi:hypothetical protein